MSVVSIAPPEADRCPIGSALKNLAKLEDLPPFTHLYQSNQTALVAVPEADAEGWRRALGAGPFLPDMAEHTITWRTEVFWFGAKVKLVYVTEV